MTCYPFWKHNTKKISSILDRLAVGQKLAQVIRLKMLPKKSKVLVEFLKSERDFTKFHKKINFGFMIYCC